MHEIADAIKRKLRTNVASKKENYCKHTLKNLLANVPNEAATTKWKKYNELETLSAPQGTLK